MRNCLFLIMLSFIFIECRSLHTDKIYFIYHTSDYDSYGVIYEERLYNSLTGIYEYKEYYKDKIQKDIKIYLKYDNNNLEDLWRFYSSSKPYMCDCYYKNGIITHKSTITLNSNVDNFNLLKCRQNENNAFIKIENKIEAYITSSNIYKATFHWESYLK